MRRTRAGYRHPLSGEVVIAAVGTIFRVSSSDNCAFIRTCLGLYHIEDFVRKRTAKFVYNVVTKQFPNDVG